MSRRLEGADIGRVGFGYILSSMCLVIHNDKHAFITGFFITSHPQGCQVVIDSVAPQLIGTAHSPGQNDRNLWQLHSIQKVSGLF